MNSGFLKIEKFRIASIQNNQSSRLRILRKINQDFSREIAKVKKIYITSSCELMFLQDDTISEFFEDIFYQYYKATFSIISLGCLGFHATLLDFYQSTEQEALVYVIDSPSSELQTMLNAIGIGVLNNQDGLVSKEGIAICHLKKVNLLEDKSQNKTSSAFLKGAYVNSIKILALEKKLSSTLSLVNHFVQHILDIKTSVSKCVSFQISSGWSASLMWYLSLFKEQWLMKENLLPSLEQDHFHLHALKSLYELEHYVSYFKNGDLIIPCLGAAGRIGILQLSAAPGPALILDRIDKLVVHDYRDLPRTERIKKLKQALNYHGMNQNNMREYLYFMNKDYTASGNYFFEWIL